MPEPKALTVEQREILRGELVRDDLSIYTVARMAREDVAAGRFDAAVARLRVDADKILMHNRLLYDIIMDQYN